MRFPTPLPSVPVVAPPLPPDGASEGGTDSGVDPPRAAWGTSGP